MSINLNQIFVRYPDPKDAAELLADFQKKKMPGHSFVVARAGEGWLAVVGGDNTVPPDVAPLLSRALEAQAVWFGLAGNTLAYRLLRYDLGREVERALEPQEIFTPEGPLILPAYKDVEDDLYRKLRSYGIPREYIYLFVEELGVSGGTAGEPDAAAARPGGLELFRHRVPRRGTDGVRTLFDLYKEGDQRVYESLTLHGGYEESRALQLMRTLAGICRRRTLPGDWKVRFQVGSPKEPATAAQVLELHAKGRHPFEMEAAAA
ncbi:MAG TPA: hypothetical protein VF950_04440 [Planctomycetota bacterium]